MRHYIAVILLLLFTLVGCNAPQPVDTVGSLTGNPPTEPRITASTSEALVGETVELTAASSDADGDPLTYLWRATGGAFVDPRIANTTWIAPNIPGDYTLSVTVSDTLTEVVGQVEVEVVVAEVANPTPVPGEPTPIPPGEGEEIEAVATAPAAEGPFDEQIVYTCYDGTYDHICTMNPDGSNVRQLTSNPATDFYGEWDWDGSGLLFSSRQDGNFRIYSMPAGGGTQQRIGDAIDVYGPQRSPDGQQIVFARAQTDGSQDVWVMDADGGNPRQLTTGGSDLDAQWSPDGQYISFASSRTGVRELYIMRADGSDVRQVTSGIADMGGRNDWSPDGQTLAFYAGQSKDHDLYLVDINAGDITRLTDGDDNKAPSFSPDGEWVVFASRRSGVNEIWKLNIATREWVQLTDTGLANWQPRWGP